MADMPKTRLPHLRHEKSRHGKWAWYVRRKDGKRTRIRAEYGTDEFEAEYMAALGNAPTRPKRKATAPSSSVQWLYDGYRDSTAWASLSVATRRQRENILGHVMASIGQRPFAEVTRAMIEKARDRRKSTPAQARNFLDAMKGLFRWAKERGHVAVDPTDGVTNLPRGATDGFLAWTIEDVVKYEARWPEGSKERVWLHVLLYIGCRRGDAVQIGRQHVRDGVITFVTEKGRSKRRLEVSRRIEPELAATLERGPCGDLAFICGERGQPLTKESFGNFFKAACQAAGLKDRSAHGLRKLSATLWAERGATEMELMAMFGWTTPQMAALYTRTASRKALSLNAQDRFLGTVRQHNSAAPYRKVRRTSQKNQ